MRRRMVDRASALTVTLLLILLMNQARQQSRGTGVIVGTFAESKVKGQAKLCSETLRIKALQNCL